VSVTNLLVKVQYTADGILTKFAITPAFFIDPNDPAKPLVDTTPTGDIYVYEGAPGVVQNTGFTVYGPGDPTNPSSIIFGSAPSSGTLITLVRRLPLTQLVRFIPGQPLNASMIEEALDKLTFICQQLQEELNRTAMLDISSNSAAPIVLPVPSANMYLRWDPTGTFLIDDPGPTVTVISGQTWPFRIVFDTSDPVTQGKAPSDYSGFTGSTWNVGDTCIITAPAPGAYEGYKCTTSGTKVTAVFKPYGPISRS